MTIWPSGTQSRGDKDSQAEHERDPSCGSYWSSVPMRTTSSEMPVKFLGTFPTQSLTICCSFEQAEEIERKRIIATCPFLADLILLH